MSDQTDPTRDPDPRSNWAPPGHSTPIPPVNEPSGYPPGAQHPGSSGPDPAASPYAGGQPPYGSGPHHAGTAPYGMPPQYPGGGPGQPYPGGYDVRPGIVPIRPLSLGDIYDGSVRAIRMNPAAMLGLTVCVLLVTQVIAQVLDFTLGGSLASASRSVDSSVPLGGIPGNLVSTLGGLILDGMLTVVIADAVLGQRVRIGTAWSRVRPRLLPLIGLSLLVALLFLAPIAVAALLIAILYAVFGGSSVAFVLLCVLLGLAALCAVVAVSVLTGAAPQAVVLEEAGPVAALKRSVALIRPAFWRYFGIRVLTSLIVSVVGAIIAAVIGAIIGGVVYFIGGSLTVFVLIVSVIAAVVSGLIVTPFASGVTNLLYFDLRMRHEGFDMRLLSELGRLAPGPGPAPRP